MKLDECINKICDCYEETEKVLLELEKAINYLFVCSPEEVFITNENIIQYRQMAEELMTAAEEICKSDVTGSLSKAADPQSSRKDIDDNTECIFNARQNINAVLFRIKNVIPQVEKRISKEKDKCMEKIKNNNISQSANVSKYFSAVVNDNDQFHLGKNRSI